VVENDPMERRYLPEVRIITQSAKFHYVYKVDVEKNGVLVVSQQYTSQPRIFFYTYSYEITASSGDQITVTANCVLFGKLIRSITLP
jgi:hypothetical protein